MNIIALVTHLKLVAQEAKKYAAGLASELSNATLEAMQEMDRAKVDRLSSVPVTIKADGWVKDETWAGKICIWARKAPAEALTAEYRIIQGEKPKEE